MILSNRFWIMLMLGLCTLAQMQPAVSAPVLQGASTLGQSGDPADKERVALDQALQLQIVGSTSGGMGRAAIIEVQLQNKSANTITAHAGRLLGRYADGTEKTAGWAQDILGVTVLSRYPGLRLQSPATLNGGETRLLKLSLPLDPRGAPPVYVTAAVTMVIFEDRTALGDPEQIRLILEQRAQDSADLAELLAVAQKERDDPAVKNANDAGLNPAAAARLATSLTARMNELDDVKTRPQWYARSAFRLQALRDAASSPAGIVGFDLSLLMEQVTQRALAEHSSLKEVK